MGQCFFFKYFPHFFTNLKNHHASHFDTQIKFTFPLCYKGVFSYEIGEWTQLLRLKNHMLNEKSIELKRAMILKHNYSIQNSIVCLYQQLMLCELLIQDFSHFFRFSLHTKTMKINRKSKLFNEAKKEIEFTDSIIKKTSLFQKIAHWKMKTSRKIYIRFT